MYYQKNDRYDQSMSKSHFTIPWEKMHLILLFRRKVLDGPPPPSPSPEENRRQRKITLWQRQFTYIYILQIAVLHRTVVHFAPTSKRIEIGKSDMSGKIMHAVQYHSYGGGAAALKVFSLSALLFLYSYQNWLISH